MASGHDAAAAAAATIALMPPVSFETEREFDGGKGLQMLYLYKTSLVAAN